MATPVAPPVEPPVAPLVAPQVVPPVSVAPAPAVQSVVQQITSAPQTTAAPTFVASSPAPSSAPQPLATPAGVAPQPPASEADPGPTALSITPVAATPSVAPSVAPADAPVATTTPEPEAQQAAPEPPQSQVLESSAPTIGLASTTVVPGSVPTSGTSTAGGISSTDSNGSGSTLKVAGGVIGAVALISLLAFLIWFWRRRLAKKRRDTLLTPLSPDPSFSRELQNERPYRIQPGSIGPTPRMTKAKAALRAQYGQVVGRFNTMKRSTSVRSHASHSTGPSVDMNRGNSQFMDTPPITGRDRKNSSALSGFDEDDSDLSMKERIMELWTRVTGSGKQNLPGDEKNDIFAARGIRPNMREKPEPSSRPLANKPDFLTLLNMDDGELDREAQRRRMSRTRGGSEGSGVGALNLDFGANPFSDANAITSNQSRNGPPLASGPNNPFTDANAIQLPKPSTYIDGIRRSRNQSMGSSDLSKMYGLGGLRVVNEGSRPPSGATGLPRTASQYSDASFESFVTKRDKFRSDPFDLEQLASQASGSIPGYTPRPSMGNSNYNSIYQYDSVARPNAARLTTASSKYTSGFSQASLDDWSDPGPDVGTSPARRPAIPNLGQAR